MTPRVKGQMLVSRAGMLWQLTQVMRVRVQVAWRTGPKWTGRRLSKKTQTTTKISKCRFKANETFSREHSNQTISKSQPKRLSTSPFPLMSAVEIRKHLRGSKMSEIVSSLRAFSSTCSAFNFIFIILACYFASLIQSLFNLPNIQEKILNFDYVK